MGGQAAELEGEYFFPAGGGAQCEVVGHIHVVFFSHEGVVVLVPDVVYHGCGFGGGGVVDEYACHFLAAGGLFVVAGMLDYHFFEFVAVCVVGQLYEFVDVAGGGGADEGVVFAIEFACQGQAEFGGGDDVGCGAFVEGHEC